MNEPHNIIANSEDVIALGSHEEAIVLHQIHYILYRALSRGESTNGEVEFPISWVAEWCCMSLQQVKYHLRKLKEKGYIACVHNGGMRRVNRYAVGKNGEESYDRFVREAVIEKVASKSELPKIPNASGETSQMMGQNCTTMGQNCTTMGQNCTTMGQNCTTMGQNCTTMGQNCTTESVKNDPQWVNFRPHKENKESNKKKEREREGESRNASLTPSQVPYPIDETEVLREAKARGFSWEREEARRFLDHYAALGWMVSNSKIHDWRALITGWEAKRENFTGKKPHALDMRDYSGF